MFAGLLLSIVALYDRISQRGSGLPYGGCHWFKSAYLSLVTLAEANIYDDTQFFWLNRWIISWILCLNVRIVLLHSFHTDICSKFYTEDSFYCYYISLIGVITVLIESLSFLWYGRHKHCCQNPMILLNPKENELYSCNESHFQVKFKIQGWILRFDTWLVELCDSNHMEEWGKPLSKVNIINSFTFFFLLSIFWVSFLFLKGYSVFMKPLNKCFCNHEEVLAMNKDQAFS